MEKQYKRQEIKGKRLTKHPNHHNTLVYSPIKELMHEEIWYIINALRLTFNKLYKTAC